jgi:Flp pilus assembly pilin Flp
MNMRNLVKRLISEEAGQDLAEYGIALAVIAAGAAAIAVAIGGDVQTLWSNAQDDITDAVNAGN